MAELLSVSGLTKRFSGLEVLKDVSLEVSAGELVGLIGPNGAGKTTLFNIIAGSLKPDAGKVVFSGRDITGIPPHRIARLGIARTFQIPQPFSEMTVLENVRAASYFRGDSARGKLPNDPAELCGLTGLGSRLERRAGSLTVSEKKRLEVARALSLSPELLMLDEFAAGLAVAEAEWATGITRKLSKEYGITIIWTEHVMRVLMRSVGRVLVLQEGKLIAQGTPEEVVKDERVLSAYFGAKQS
ncbi:MAG: ABC transporter ATP-binding protein [Nitrososphaerota archaeon]|nr:ABC transporter ATP-binding protein [Nitrososphaerota archaeon]